MKPTIKKANRNQYYVIDYAGDKNNPPDTTQARDHRRISYFTVIDDTYNGMIGQTTFIGDKIADDLMIAVTYRQNRLNPFLFSGNRLEGTVRVGFAKTQKLARLCDFDVPRRWQYMRHFGHSELLKALADHTEFLTLLDAWYMENLPAAQLGI